MLRIIIVVFGVTSVVIAAGVIYLLLRTSPSPVPANIQKQISFRVIYPSGYDLPANSWHYSASDSTLSFNAKVDDQEVIFTEQPTPLAYKNDLAAYSRFIGSLRPSANFTVPLGSASIVRFITAGEFQDQGRTGILNADGTMMLMHPVQGFTDDQWQNVFNSLKATK